MSNNETFIATNNIHNLQEFHIHYGMYVVARRFGILLLFFSLFCGISLFKMEIMEGYVKEIFMSLSLLFLRAYFWLNNERNFSIQDSIFQARKKD
jgi:membrane-associated protease RseP (regulator of RpoE activity)